MQAWFWALEWPDDEQQVASSQIDADREALEIRAAADYEKKKIQARTLAQAEAENDGQRLRTLRSVRADSVIPRRVRWLWDKDGGRIPMGELTLIVGRGGVGKSTLLCTFAAWITIGDMRGEFDGIPRDVIYVPYEDAYDYTVVPRLMAAGADLSRVHFLEMDFAGRQDRLMLPSDCEAIEQFAKENNAVAVMLDPLSSSIRGKKNDGDEMRPVIESVRKMCERAGIAAIGLGHTRKGQSKDLLEAMMGSSELGNVCRSAMGVMVDPDEDDAIVLSQEKNNLGRLDVPGYVYRIQSHQFEAGGEMISTARLEFLRKTDQKVGEMIAEQSVGGESKSAMRDAVDFLKHYLLTRPESPKKDIVQAGLAEGHSQRTVERAADRLKVVRARQKFGGGVFWSLPGQSVQNPLVDGA